MFKEISIIGLGFMGASIAGAVKTANPEIKISGYDIIQKKIDYCLSGGIIDYAMDFKTNAHKNPYYGNSIDDLTSLVILCTTPKAILTLFDRYKTFFENAPFITDIGSVKSVITHNAEIKNFKNFVGSHPICGSDKSGPENADFNLFKNKNCVVIREDSDLADKTRTDKVEAVAKFWKMLKMNVVYLAADFHDNIVAYTSHLPHLIAFVLSDTVLSFIQKEKESGNGTFSLIGSGFRDSTRIASSSPDIWTDIFLMNNENIAASLEDFIASANILKGFLETGDEESLRNIITKITDSRKKI